MGMHIDSETLSKNEMESKSLAKELGIVSNYKITEAFMQTAP